MGAPKVSDHEHDVAHRHVRDIYQGWRANDEIGNFANVECHLAEFRHQPVADNSIDMFIANGVVNLSPNKPRCLATSFT